VNLCKLRIIMDRYACNRKCRTITSLQYRVLRKLYLLFRH